jgi:hypothetical protein
VFRLSENSRQQLFLLAGGLLLMYAWANLLSAALGLGAWAVLFLGSGFVAASWFVRPRTGEGIVRLIFLGLGAATIFLGLFTPL